MLRSSCAGDLLATLFIFFTASIKHFCFFLLKWCVLCLQLFSVFFYTIFFFAFQLFIYLFAPRTVVCADTHTHLLHMDLVFVVTHTTGGDVSGRWSETKKREDCAGLYLIVCSPVCFNFLKKTTSESHEHFLLFLKTVKCLSRSRKEVVGNRGTSGCCPRSLCFIYYFMCFCFKATCWSRILRSLEHLIIYFLPINRSDLT